CPRRGYRRGLPGRSHDTTWTHFRGAESHGIRTKRAGHDPLPPFDASGTRARICSRRLSGRRYVCRVSPSAGWRYSPRSAASQVFRVPSVTALAANTTYLQGRESTDEAWGAVSWAIKGLAKLNLTKKF